MTLAKNSELQKQVLKDLLYASIKELGTNPNIYINSPFGSKYSKLTDDSVDVCLAVFEDFVVKILEIEKQLEDERFNKRNWEALKDK